MDPPAAAVAVPVAAVVVPAPPQPSPRVCSTQNIDYYSMMDKGISIWRWQQDGAGAHSVAFTDICKPTRALIEAMATLVEPWPSHSPDLSPIEKAWAAVEQHLWATMTWHDLATFKLALHASWVAVVTPAYCLALFGGLKATYSCCAWLWLWLYTRP